MDKFYCIIFKLESKNEQFLQHLAEPWTMIISQQYAFHMFFHSSLYY